jgi:hypothetical protein
MIPGPSGFADLNCYVKKLGNTARNQLKIILGPIGTSFVFGIITPCVPSQESRGGGRNVASRSNTHPWRHLTPSACFVPLPASL